MSVINNTRPRLKNQIMVRGILVVLTLICQTTTYPNQYPFTEFSTVFASNSMLKSTHIVGSVTIPRNALE